MGSHHGTIDTAPYDKDLLCRNCIRYLTIFKIVDSHAVQIHSSNAVIVRLIATVFTSKQMHLAANLQSSSHRPRAVSFRLQNRKDSIYENTKFFRPCIGHPSDYDLMINIISIAVGVLQLLIR